MPSVRSAPPLWPCCTAWTLRRPLPLPAGPTHSLMRAPSASLRRLGWGKSLRARGVVQGCCAGGRDRPGTVRDRFSPLSSDSTRLSGSRALRTASSAIFTRSLGDTGEIVGGWRPQTRLETSDTRRAPELHGGQACNCPSPSPRTPWTRGRAYRDACIQRRLVRTASPAPWRPASARSPPAAARSRARTAAAAPRSRAPPGATPPATRRAAAPAASAPCRR